MYFRRMVEEQRRMAEEQEAEAMKQALGVDESQWKVLPRYLGGQAARVSAGGVLPAVSSSKPVAAYKVRDFTAPHPALRKAREKARKQLVHAQQELRKVLTFRQQARLVLMGLLD